MTDRIDQLRDEWETIDIPDGIEGLEALERRQFSGIISASGATMLMAEGVCLAIEDGTVEVFETHPLEAYSAPDPSVVVLLAMKAGNGNDRGRYYTEDTSIDEIDSKLAEQNFTGYLELSENVLSGDYYLVFQQGESAAVSFVGPSNRLNYGDAAREGLDSELGIYTVTEVALDPVALPTTDAEEPDSEPETIAFGSPPGEDDNSESPVDNSSEEQHSTNRLDEDTSSEEAIGIEDTDDPDHSSASDDPSRPDDPSEEATNVASTERDDSDTFEDENESNDALSYVTDDAEASPNGPQTEPDTLSATSPTDPSSPPEPTQTTDEPKEADSRVPKNEGGLTHDPGSIPQSVLEATRLFVRYKSNSGPTVQSAVDESIQRATLRKNLVIEHHTDADLARNNLTQDHFQTTLEQASEFRFLEWLVTDLLFDIKQSGSRDRLKALFEVLPAIDYVEFDGRVSPTESEPVTFDVVAYDKGGNALIVANFSKAGSGTSSGEIEQLIEDATVVATETKTLGAAFLVTESYFEPAVIELLEAETSGGGFLSRSPSAALIKPNRKSAYHCCLVEARTDRFHLEMPNL